MSVATSTGDRAFSRQKPRRYPRFRASDRGNPRARVIRSSFCHPQHSVFRPGSPSLLRSKKPPSRATLALDKPTPDLLFSEDQVHRLSPARRVAFQRVVRKRSGGGAARSAGDSSDNVGRSCQYGEEDVFRVIPFCGSGRKDAPSPAEWRASRTPCRLRTTGPRTQVRRRRIPPWRDRAVD